jgi:ribosomal protein S18 acetylase RimI-like enzyme
MDGLTLRPARIDDVANVITLWALAAENAGRAADRPEAVEALIRRDPDALTLAELSGDLVGTLIAGWDGWRFHLYRLAVHPDARRRGVAQALVDQAEARFAALGGTRADAMVLDDNDLGQTLWAAAGYHRQTDSSRWVKTL